MNPTAIVHFCHPMNTCRATPMTSQSACFKVNMFVDSHNKNRFEHTIYSHLGMLPQLFISPGQSIDGQSHFAINRAKKKKPGIFSYFELHIHIHIDVRCKTWYRGQKPMNMFFAIRAPCPCLLNIYHFANIIAIEQLMICLHISPDVL